MNGGWVWQNNMKHEIIIFYKYVSIQDPKATVEWYRALCEKHNLKGRTMIAHEGINSTVEGSIEDLAAYETELRANPLFSDVIIKRSEGTGKAFKKLIVKVRNEIVTLGLPKEQDIDPNKVTGVHLKPEELRDWLTKKEKDFVIVDMRNDYEWKLGRFKDSVTIPMRNFRELQHHMDAIKNLKDKTVVTVCTAGVRCEKASGYLLSQGFKDVYQLDGGIHTYLEKYKHEDFHGKLYVFDERMTMTMAPDGERPVIGECDFCKAKTENCENCSYLSCHVHLMICDACKEKAGGVWCNENCKAKWAERKQNQGCEVVIDM